MSKVSDIIKEILPSALLGDYQKHNIKAVLQTIAVLNSQNEFVVSVENIKNGLLNVIKNTGLQGRWQQLNNAPKVFCDTAHNKHGLEIVLNQVQNEKYETLHIVLGVLTDKDLNEILPLFPKKAKYYFCKPNILRGLNANILQQKAIDFQLEGEVFNSVSDAYKSSLLKAGIQDFIYIGGSTFVVAEVL